jgi:hypothetical protein
MALIEILEKRWYVIVAILGIIILLLIWSGYFSFVFGDSFSTLHLYELNGSYIPEGTRFSLTEQDFKEFPQLRSAIREKNQKPQKIFPDGTRSYSFPLTESEMYRFNDRYWRNISGEDRRIFEYNGKNYEFTFPEMH